MRVLIAGDVVREHYIYEGQRLVPGSTVLEGTRSISDLGGAGLVGKLLKAVASPGTGGTTAAGAVRFDVDLGFDDAPNGPPVRDGFCVMQLCDRQLGKEQPRVWRMTQSLGYSSGEPVVHSKHIRANALDQFADIVVLDDAGLGFRLWPNRHAWPTFLREPRAADSVPRWIVLKMSGALVAGDLWHTIISGHTQPDGRTGSPAPQLLGPLAARTVLVLSIDELRREAVRVDGRLSWERAVTDLIQDLETSPRLKTLKNIRLVVVRFGLDGALIVDRPPAEKPTHTLVFDPAGIEGTFLSGVPQGYSFGYQSCLAAAIVSRLADATPNPQETRASVVSGVRAGLNAMRRLIVDGHESEKSPNPPDGFPYARIAQEIGKEVPEWPFASVERPAALMLTPSWTIVANASASPARPLWGLARRVALHGVGQLSGVPFLQFAKLFSVDRSEIESYRTIQRLLTSYRLDLKAAKPLSIAAFGPPGAGKSFGVKQLAEALFGDKHPLEFNLSQFSTAGELHALFHQIRDRVLQGQLPIVFWDEFDSRELMWLQYLLAPMQDGTFQDGQVTHPIGKCVFVFAGGTRDRFEDFGEPSASPLAPSEQVVQKWRDEFRMKKGTDFKSRLGGYINVLGPNPRDAEDVTFPVRRALLLRVHLGLKATGLAAIDAGLLDAFLRIREYRHGARSLEKIAEQVRLSSRAGAFNRSDLPPRQQIDLHVNADEFLAIVESA